MKVNNQNGVPPAPAPAETPAVITWFKVYCVLMVLMSLATIGGGIFFLVAGSQIPESEMPAAIRAIYGVVLLVLGIVFLAAFVTAFFIPQKSWVWVYDLVLICLGLTSCCTLIFSIPLLIYWLKPETKAYFGR